MDWKLADAKTRFSEVVRRALMEGPQRILRRNDVVVLLSEEDYERLAGSRPGFRAFLLDAPDMDALDLAREKQPMRDVTL